MGHIKYSSNNSGGSWWLTDQNWLDLEKAGWKVKWVKDDPYWKGQDRFLNALALSATREGLSMKMAVAEFEDITGQDSWDEGCSCCGQPHEFYEIDDYGNYVW